MHAIHPRLARPYGPIKVLIVGAGGNGSKVAIGLRHLSAALETIHGPHHRLDVTIADGDTIEHHNLVRQAFYPSDIGQNKATVLANRINLSNGTTWRAIPRHITAEDITHLRPAIVIACVDNRAARAAVHAAAEHKDSGVLYTLDLGNTATTGQVILGMPRHAHTRELGPRLPTAPELHPELTDTSVPEDDTPSCSTIESLEKQDLYVNDTLATHALNLLWQLLRHGRIGHHGVYVDTSTNHSTPLPVDPRTWRRMRRRLARTAKTTPAATPAKRNRPSHRQGNRETERATVDATTRSTPA
mgnify:CR=1 FL=1